MSDFPQWFFDFSSAQLENIEGEYEKLELKSLEEIQIQYIKVWSVVEIFSKIVVTLSAKREYLRQIEPELNVIETKLSDINRYKKELEELIKYFKSSISGDSLELKFEAINAATCQLKRKKFKKFSVSKNIIFKSNLPKQEAVDKALKSIGAGKKKFTKVLSSEDKESSYYKTRNKIAHEGAVDISRSGFIKERFMVILKAAREINITSGQI